jgi:hypothetical protein
LYGKKIALLVRKPIFDEMRAPLGDAYVEELMTMRSDAEYDLFGEHTHQSLSSLHSDQPLAPDTQMEVNISNEEIEEFKAYVEETGENITIDLNNIQNIT